jgi:hypothetical protein
MIDPALWQAEGLTEGEDTANVVVGGDAPSTTACGRGPQCKVDHAPGMILDCRGQSNLALPLREGGLYVGTTPARRPLICCNAATAAKRST